LLVVYESNTVRVLSVIDNNGGVSRFSAADISMMYPGVSVSFVSANFPQVKPGYSVVMSDGVVTGCMSPDGVEFSLPSEDVELAMERLRAERMSKAKFRIDSNFDRLFTKIVPELRQTSPHVAPRMSDGSFFEKLSPVGWWGSFLDAGGYANMNREIVLRLPSYGFAPVVDIYPTITQVGKPVENVLRMMSVIKPLDSRHPKVYAFTPMPHSRNGGKSIFFTMMETSTLHADFVRYCNAYSDEVWVPSAANAELFRRNGVRKAIRTVPLGIDETLYSSEKGCVDLSACKGIYGRPPTSGVGKFKFLTVIQWNFRKGYDALIKSFFEAYGEDDDVALVIATQYSEDTVRNTLDRYIPRKDDMPQVLLYNSIIPIALMPHLYDSCDCYVHLSRGEGFSLTQIEAAARGLPVISCLHSGMTEYLRGDNSYPVHCNDIESCPSELAAISYFYQGQKLWRVGEAQVEQASAHMRAVVSDRDGAKRKAEKLGTEVFSMYTWKSAVTRVAGLLQ
jgi:glycosyltransferase involved in cell wall biosynthesis